MEERCCDDGWISKGDGALKVRLVKDVAGRWWWSRWWRQVGRMDVVLWRGESGCRRDGETKLFATTRWMLCEEAPSASLLRFIRGQHGGMQYTVSGSDHHHHPSIYPSIHPSTYQPCSIQLEEVSTVSVLSTYITLYPHLPPSPSLSHRHSRRRSRIQVVRCSSRQRS
jgi:hypothetical protein